jgi:endonuclease/exonuclease/phosphatase family metal-dependent hydrolase
MAQALLSLLITLVFIGRGGSTARTTFSSITITSGLGMILLLVFLVGYYMVYYFSLPYNNAILEPLAAFIVAACALYALSAPRIEKSVNYRAWPMVVLALLLLILPLSGMIMWRAPEAGEGFPVRVMTYNLHNGFNTEGYLGMEDIAQVIESQDPDIVALQEVSRGWVISGRLDMLSWLSKRLDMPYVSGPTADPFWGNAILSRYPIVDYMEYALPPPDLPVRRGLLSTTIDLGNGEQIRVIATHYHHVEGATGIRQLQAQETIKIWDNDKQTVLLGDLNAIPDDPEMVMLQEAGLVDALMGIEPPPAYTWPSSNPDRRIDYIWISPDLKSSGVHVIASNASDHLAVVAEINR